MKGIKGFQKGHKDYRTPDGLAMMKIKLKGMKRTEETKRKMSERKKRDFAEGRLDVRGSKNPAWKGGITPETNKARRSLEYVIWRDEVYKKDGWRCRICKTKCRKGQIVAHHLKLFSEFPELRFSIDNGITLCRSCHILVHKGLVKI